MEMPQLETHFSELVTDLGNRLRFNTGCNLMIQLAVFAKIT